MSQQDRENARQVIVPLQECDFCLTCPDHAAHLIDAIVTALEQGRERCAVAMCFRCQNKKGYSVAQFVSVPEGTETSGRKAWQHTDRCGSLFPCLAAAIRQG